jgi:polysaccharide chain length determinant protein (PEP-CTERM system associated)
MQSWKLQALAVLSGAWQYRFQGLAAAWVVCIAGWVGVGFIPNRFESSAVVYIDTDTLLVPLLRGLAVDVAPDQQINMMLHTLLTAPNMETVVRTTDSDAGAMTHAQMQDAVANLQHNVTLRNSGAKNLYTISYGEDDPRRAQQVAQRLVEVLVDSNLGNRRRDADDVKTFLDNQIADYERKLREAEARRAAFRAAHLDVFSGQGDLVTARASVATAQTALDEDLLRRNSLQAQLSGTSATMDVNAPSAVIVGSNSPTSRRSELAAARARLANLRANFTDDYPDVVSTKKLIARLESELTDKSGTSDDDQTQGISNPAYLMLREKLADADTGLAIDRGRLADAQKRFEQAQKTTVSALSIGRQFEDMDRDYKVLHDNYETLVERRESASISQAAGDERSSFVFRVVEPPRKPDRPVAPNRILFNAIVLLAGLAVGAGVATLLSRVSGRFMTMQQLTGTFALPTLGSVTLVRTTRDVLAARTSTVFFVACTGLLLMGYVVVLFFFHTAVASGSSGGII